MNNFTVKQIIQVKDSEVFVLEEMVSCVRWAGGVKVK